MRIKVHADLKAQYVKHSSRGKTLSIHRVDEEKGRNSKVHSWYNE